MTADLSGVFETELRTYRELRGSSGPRPRALDVGSGIGRVVAVLKRAGFDAEGLEPSPAFAEAARSMFGLGESIREGSIEEASFPDDHFDFITFGAVLEHLYDPGTALSRAVAWLKPGGLLHLEVPSANWLLGRALNAYYRVIGTDYVTNVSPMHPPFHLYEFTPDSFRRNSARGYSIARLERHAGGTPLPAVIDAPLRLLMKATRTGMLLTLWLRRSG